MAQLSKKYDNNQYLYSLEDNVKLAFMLNMRSSKEGINQNNDNDDADDDFHLSRKSISSTVDIIFYKIIT